MSELDIEKLNEIFARENPFEPSDICDDCGRNECSCCGNSIDCGYTPNKCPKVIEAGTEHISITLENFEFAEIKGLKMVLNRSRILGIVDKKVPIEVLSEIYSPYEEISPYFLKTPVKTHDEFYEIPDSKAKLKNKVFKELVDKSLSLVNNPCFYYSHDVPLIIQDDKITVLIAVRVEEEDFADDNDEEEF